MTKRREPLTFESALQEAASLIGIDLCAAICSVTTKTIRNWSDHDVESEIGLQDALRIDNACYTAAGKRPFLRVFTLRSDIAERETAAKDLARAAANAAKESGEAISALVLAADPRACADTRRTARREAGEAIEALTEGLAALDRRDAAEAGD